MKKSAKLVRCVMRKVILLTGCAVLILVAACMMTPRTPELSARLKPPAPLPDDLVQPVVYEPPAPEVAGPQGGVLFPGALSAEWLAGFAERCVANTAFMAGELPRRDLDWQDMVTDEAKRADALQEYVEQLDQDWPWWAYLATGAAAGTVVGTIVGAQIAD